MTALYAQVLLTALVLAIPATLALFIGTPRPPRRPLAVRVTAASLAVALAALALGALGEASAGHSLVTALLLGGAVAGFGGHGRGWNTRGLLAWSLTVCTGAGYLLYVAAWLLDSSLSSSAQVGGWLLWALELFVYVLGLGYLWELVDVLARWDWRRRAGLRKALSDDAGDARPFVSLHVPLHNEPPDLVIRTLGALLALEYDEYEVLVLDNNTDDPALWEPVRDFCATHERLRFFHLENWPGFKSGALNFGLEQTDPRAELIGVVDADYLVDPDFLRRCAPLFADDRLAFLQTPQDYRDWETDSYFRRLYHSYAYFFDVSQRSRNERDGAIFGGTMGLIRRHALAEVGGWDEWCITEDAELSLRLLRAGWSGTHVERSFGRGIMPLTFEALKRQRFRWCFGGVQILRMHLRSLLPGPRTEHNQLSLAQRWAYLVGGLQWFGDLAGLLFTGFLLVGAVDVVTGDGLVVRRFSGPLLVGVIALVLLSSLRSVALIRRTARGSWRDALGALSIWLGLGWVVALASLRGLLAREGAFLRTPKTRGEVSWRDALRGNLVEAVLALACLAGAGAAFAATGHATAGGVAIGVLLLVQATGYAAAPWNSFAALRADLTPELRRRRRESMLSWTRVTPGVRRWGLGPVLAAGFAGMVVVLFAAPIGMPQVSELPRDAVPGDSSSATPTPTPGRQDGATTPVPVPGSPTSGARVLGASPTSNPTARTSATATPTLILPTQAPATPTNGKPTSKPTTANTGTGKPTSKPTQAASPTRRP